MSTSVNPSPPGFIVYEPTASVRADVEISRQVAARSREARLAMITDEGDVVTISIDSDRLQSLSKESAGPEKSFAAAGIATGSVSLSVEGDLSREELQDIKRFVDRVTGIAKDFFSGERVKTVRKALNLGDFGSLAQFSVTLTQINALAGETISTYPLPAADLARDKLFDELPGQAGTASMGLDDYARHLRSQWEQIKEYLDEKITDSLLKPPPAEIEGTPGLPPAEQMLERARETIARHPRLSPLIAPAAGRAIDHADIPRGGGGVRLAHEKNLLKNDFIKKFSNWLLAG